VATATDNRGLAFRAWFGENGAVDPQHGRAEQAGQQMDSELDAIQARLRALKRKLDAREAVIEVDDEQSAEPAINSPPRLAQRR
jgi:hypothetical protein